MSTHPSEHPGEVPEPGDGATTSNNIRGKDGEAPEGVAPKV